MIQSDAFAFLVTSIGAILGALSRHYATVFWIKQKGTAFPYGTFFVNLTGCFLIGFLSVVLNSFHTVHTPFQQFIFVGFLGSYTTFSSYILDSSNLFRVNRIQTGLLYWIGSVILGFLSVELGILLADNLI